MKLVSFAGPAGDERRLGALVDEDSRVVDCTGARPDLGALGSMEALMASGNGGLGAVSEVLGSGPDAEPLGDVRLLAPVEHPAQVRDCLCFEEHLRGALAVAKEIAVVQAPDQEAKRREIDEQGTYEVPQVWYRQPIYYKGNRFATAGPDEEVSWPGYANLLDFELEIGAWIGTEVKDATPETAADCIFGYSIFNDFTARDAQLAEMEGQLGPAKGKDFDGANAVGPCIVTADSIDPTDLTMVARVNGEEIARNSSSTMHWSFPEVIAHISASETLHPGELLGSGTVGGGCGLEHRRFLEPGDEVELEIDGIGVLRNRIVKEPE